MKKLEDLLIAAQNRDPDRLDPARDELLQLLWARVQNYRFAVQPRAVALLEEALKCPDALARLAARSAFPF
jgi:hypothetical protein